MPDHNEIDITKNIKMIESFQCELLNSVAELFSSMANLSSVTEDRAEILSNIIVLSYLLSDKLGIPYSVLDTKSISRMKREILTEGSSMEWHSNLAALCKHLDKNRDIRK